MNLINLESVVDDDLIVTRRTREEAVYLNSSMQSNFPLNHIYLYFSHTSHAEEVISQKRKNRWKKQREINGIKNECELVGYDSPSAASIIKRGYKERSIFSYRDTLITYNGEFDAFIKDKLGGKEILLLEKCINEEIKRKDIADEYEAYGYLDPLDASYAYSELLDYVHRFMTIRRSAERRKKNEENKLIELNLENNVKLESQAV